MPDVAASLDVPVELGVSGAMVRRGAQMVRRHVALKRKTFTIAVCGAAIFAVGTIAQSFVFGWIVDHVITPRFERWAGRRRRGHRWRDRAGRRRRRARRGSRCCDASTRVAPRWASRRSCGATSSTATRTSRSRTSTRTRPASCSPTCSPTRRPRRRCSARCPYACGTVMLVVIATVWMFATDWVLGLVALLALPGDHRPQRRLPAPHRRRLPRTRTEPHRRRVQRGARERRRRDRGQGARRRGVGVGEVRRRGRAAARRQHPAWRCCGPGFDAVLDSLPSLATILLVALGAWRVARARSTAGDVVSFVTLFGFMVWPLRLIGFVLGDLPRSVAGDDRVRAVLAGEVDRARHLGVVGRRRRPRLPSGPLSVRFDEVTFGYEEARDVLDHFDVTIPAGPDRRDRRRARDRARARSWRCSTGWCVPDEGTISLGGIELSNALADAQLRRAVSPGVPGAVPVRRVGARQHRPRSRARPRRRSPARRRSRRSTSSSTTFRTVGRRPSASAASRSRADSASASRSPERWLVSPSCCSSTTPRRASTRRPRPASSPASSSLLSGTVITVASRPSTIALADDVLFVERGRVAGFGSHRELFAQRGRVPPAGRVVRQGAGGPMSAPARRRPDRGGTARRRCSAIMRRGWRASPELRDGIGSTILLAGMGAAGRVVIPVLVQQVIDKGFTDGQVDVARVVSLSVAGAVVAVVATVVHDVRRRGGSPAPASTPCSGCAPARSATSTGCRSRTMRRSGAAALVSRVTTDVETLSQFFKWGGIAWVVNGLVIVAVLITMFVFNWKLALVAIVHERAAALPAARAAEAADRCVRHPPHQGRRPADRGVRGRDGRGGDPQLRHDRGRRPRTSARRSRRSGAPGSGRARSTRSCSRRASCSRCSR